ncbi:iron reductase [Athelia psychrophila]|uniref:Iron reductase n=1 Tax=Athelia psychrophila TaxID=1759441 RepID=A0A166WIR4_9AGAM|nr:iron reductase [Fibularhizoctonia sp. CBS 109695]
MSGAPVIPTALQIYNSYVEDPIWQRRFTVVWASLTGLAILASAPHLYRSIKRGTAFKGFFGVSEDFTARRTSNTSESTDAALKPAPRRSTKWAALTALGSVRLWALPGLELNAGQITVILAYLVLTLICITMNAPLVDNPNRAGFLALAQLPIVFLFGTKNSILSLLLGPGHGYEKLNYVHRWSGRAMFLGAGVHGALWIRNHIQYDLPILGQQKETTGVTAFALLGIIVLTSLKPVRKWCYSVFFTLHVFAFVAFFVTLCYHTIYASPWIFPPLALYGADMLLRLLKYRIKDATITTVDNQMTIIRIADCTDGWTAGQHLQLRVFFGGRFYESHPLTILNAPPSTSCIRPASSAHSGELILGARVAGDWTRALNRYAVGARDHHASLGEKPKEGENAPAQVQVMLDGPYGGCSLDLGAYERVLLVAGGSGLTFALGLLDDIVGRCVKRGRRDGERTKRVDVSWCVKGFGSIEWFAPMLMDIATAAQNSSLEVHIFVYVTCLCDPSAISPIPNTHVTIGRPSISGLINDMLASSSPSCASSAIDVEAEGKTGRQELVVGGGGVAVCASGPESLTREAQNAVARVGPRRAGVLGGIGIHTELFSL